eukprot:29912-Pelagococcus_subviridis.AAC.2
MSRVRAVPFPAARARRRLFVRRRRVGKPPERALHDGQRERPHVGIEPVRPSAYSLRGHVRHGPDPRVTLRDRVGELPGDAEIADLHLPGVVHEHVRRLHVAVDDAHVAVKVGQPAKHAPRYGRELPLRDLPQDLRDVAQRPHVHVIQQYRNAAVGEERPVVRHDVRMRRLMQRSKLRDQVLANLRLHVHLHHLDRELRARPRVRRALHDAAAPFADDAVHDELVEADDDVAGGRRAGFRRRLAGGLRVEGPYDR